MSQAPSVSTELAPVSQTVIESVAEAEGVAPTELTPPLYEVVDPDALNSLFTTAPSTDRRDGSVRFSYNGYEVTVRSDGDVVIDEEVG